MTLMNAQLETKNAVVLTESDLKITMIYPVNPLQLHSVDVKPFLHLRISK